MASKNFSDEGQDTDSHIQQSGTKMHAGSVAAGRMVVLGPERTFQLRAAFNPKGLFQTTDSSTTLNSIPSPCPIHSHAQPDIRMHGSSSRNNDRSEHSISGSYSLSSYDQIIQDAKKPHRKWRKRLCYSFMAAFFCIGIGAAFGIYFGFRTTKVEKYTEQVYRGKIKVIQGDSYITDLSDTKSHLFSEKARDYELRLDSLFKNSTVRDIYLYSEVLAFDRSSEEKLTVTFNIYVITRKSNAEVKDLEKLLRDALDRAWVSEEVVVDSSSTEIKLRSGDFIDEQLNHPLKNKNGGSEGREERVDSPFLVPESTTTGKEPPVDDIPSARDGDILLHEPDDIVPHEEGRPLTCVPVSLKFCNHLHYNSTTVPNIFRHRGPREGERLVEAAKILAASECSPFIQHILCHLLQPPCVDETETVPAVLLPPCRSVCSAVSASCRTKLGFLSFSRRSDDSKEVVAGLRDLLQCDIFPLDDGLGLCNSKPVPNRYTEREPSQCVSAMMADGHGEKVCDGLMDCHDFSDEMACDYCPHGFVHCGVGAACISSDKRCDGKADCPNGSDERGCLTIAPDMDAANFVHQYFNEGFAIITEGNKTGKICVDSLTVPSIPASRRNNFLEQFGNAACTVMSYKTMNRIEIRTDDEDTSEYAHLTENGRPRPVFQKSGCPKRQVLHLSCADLACGIRPVHMHPDRPAASSALLAASHGDWPWFAALFKDGVHSCDATLVSRQWLLTSADCFESHGRALWTARFAAVRLISDAPWEQERVIVGMIRSPVPWSKTVLIKMDTPVIFSDFVRPTCVTRQKQFWLTPTSRCLSLGWSKEDETLYERTSQIVTSASCTGNGNICANYTSLPRNSCRIEEYLGSPLLCQESDGGPWFIVGIARDQYSCDKSISTTSLRNYEGTYQNYEWIMQTIQNRF